MVINHLLNGMILQVPRCFLERRQRCLPRLRHRGVLVTFQPRRELLRHGVQG